MFGLSIPIFWLELSRRVAAFKHSYFGRVLSFRVGSQCACRFFCVFLQSFLGCESYVRFPREESVAVGFCEKVN